METAAAFLRLSFYAIFVFFVHFSIHMNFLFQSRMAVYFNHNPSGTSVNDILHLAQLIRCNCFRKFDYGIIKNLAKYGKSKPPEYELSHVEVPVAIYWSKGDWFAVEKDVARLRDGLSNVVEYYQVPDEQFTHYDFSWGINAEPILFRQMMSVMAKYQT
ncbi:gastric triacylglycerol lipase-like [Ixodes scapularis]